ncbi:MAG: outer membrane beta-barrel domain-containing protein [Myxococcota bacterium]
MTYTRPARLARAVLLGVALLAFVPAARAQSPIEGLPAVRNKVLLHDGRHVLAPTFGFTVNDAYARNFLMGASWRYYIQNWLGFGVDVMGGFGADTGLADDIESELSTPDEPFTLSTTSLQLLANAAVEVVPLDGKFMLFGKYLTRMDLHLQAGFGMAMVSGDGRIDDEVSLMPMFGLGTRLYPEPWIAVGVHVRDYIVNRALASRRDGSIPGRSFGHNWMVGFSVNFFLPDEPGVRP